LTDLSQELPRNPGTELDLDWALSVQANTSAIERRCQALPGRRSIKKSHQAAWLLKAITCIDLTTLSGDDTESRVPTIMPESKIPRCKKMCYKHSISNQALLPLVPSAYTMIWLRQQYPPLRELRFQWRQYPRVFPQDSLPFPCEFAEIGESVKDGAKEIDIVISRRHVLSQDWQALYDEMKAFREASGEAHVKAILATGELGTLRNVARASLICMMAGADFIKTSTGKESVNATLPVSLTMIRQIRDYYERTGYHVGYKPAGGISKAKDALTYLALMKEELGNRWLQPDLFRFGASSLLGDIERQLEHFVSGHYSANYRHAMG
jgi:deoxyribose-phosphate aldolase